MRLAALSFLLALIVLGGCAHPPGAAPPPPAGGGAAANPAPAAPRLLHIYVDSVLPAELPERNRALAETIALTLRDRLRGPRYDVRGAESILRDSAPPSASAEALVRLCSLAGKIAPGNPPPTNSRYATYLHPNSPRLLLVVALRSTAETNTKKAELRLGGFIADSATGEILWSGQASSRNDRSDQGVRLLTAKLVRALEAQPRR